MIAYIFGIRFWGIKYILYYSVFYGSGWIIAWTKNYWESFWPVIRNGTLFICLIVFVSIVFNYDIYHTDDRLISIIMRCLAGFSGNAFLVAICHEYNRYFEKCKISIIGMYTLEIYVTHMYVNNLMNMGHGFFTVEGMINFMCSLFVTVVFTIIIIVSFKMNSITDLLFYGKIKNSK